MVLFVFVQGMSCRAIMKTINTFQIHQNGGRASKVVKIRRTRKYEKTKVSRSKRKVSSKNYFHPQILKIVWKLFLETYTLAKNSECWDLRSFPSYRPSECYQKLMLRHFVANLFFPHLLRSISVGKNKFWMNFVEKIFLSGCQVKVRRL